MCVRYLEEGSSSEEVQDMEEVEPCRVELWNEHEHRAHYTISKGTAEWSPSSLMKSNSSCESQCGVS